MKRKNGFTLIELLAIIVILAIIAVITVPIILNIIENSKKGAATDSAYGYKDAVSKWYISKLQDDNNYTLNGSYTISEGKLDDIDIPISGDKPENGTLTYTNNLLTGGCLTIGEYKVTFDSNGSVSKTEKGKCNGDEITCAKGEHKEEKKEYKFVEKSNACETYYFGSLNEFGYGYDTASKICAGEEVEGISIESDINDEHINIDEMIEHGIMIEKNNRYEFVEKSNACETFFYGMLQNYENAQTLCDGGKLEGITLQEGIEQGFLPTTELLEHGIMNEVTKKTCEPDEEITCAEGEYVYETYTHTITDKSACAAFFINDWKCRNDEDCIESASVYCSDPSELINIVSDFEAQKINYSEVKDFLSMKITKTCAKPKISTCPGCTFEWGENQIGDPVYKTHSSDIPTTGDKIFSAHVVKNNSIVRSFICTETADDYFCLEGYDATKYSLNVENLRNYIAGCDANASNHKSECRNTSPSFSASADLEGNVELIRNSATCSVNKDGASWCYN